MNGEHQLMSVIRNLAVAVSVLAQPEQRRKKKTIRLRGTITFINGLSFTGDNIMTEFPEHTQARATLQVTKENGQPFTLSVVPDWSNNTNPGALDVVPDADGMGANLRWLDEGTGQLTVTAAEPNKTVIPWVFDYVCAPGSVIIIGGSVTTPAVP